VPSDAAIEAGILDALARGLDDVARALATRLTDRRSARTGNVVVALDAAKRRRGA
jgi:hypothetical protein